jgi:hypothetical protein
VLPLLDNLGNLTKLDADGVNGGNKKSKAHPCNRIIQTVNEIGAIHKSDLMRRLNCSWGTTCHHLGKIEENWELTVVMAPARTMILPLESAPPTQKFAHLGLHPIRISILETMQRKKGNFGFLVFPRAWYCPTNCSTSHVEIVPSRIGRTGWPWLHIHASK